MRIDDGQVDAERLIAFIGTDKVQRPQNHGPVTVAVNVVASLIQCSFKETVKIVAVLLAAPRTITAMIALPG